MKFNKLEIDNPKDLIFGKSKYPVTTKRGLIIGDGKEYGKIYVKIRCYILFNLKKGFIPLKV